MPTIDSLVATMMWRRVDAPGHDVCRLARHAAGWTVSGTAVFAEQGVPARLDYVVVCDDRWHTRAAQVQGHLGPRDVDLAVTVDDQQRWYLRGKEYGVVAGCIDIDLGFTPATNALPIRRLSLDVGASAKADAAWLPLPQLSFEVLPQVYRRTDERRYRYESHGGAFTRDLVVNAEGLVESYPGLWEHAASIPPGSPLVESA